MGGRGTNFGKGGPVGKPPKQDNSPFVLAGTAATVTEKVVKAMGEENTKDAIQYIQDAITFLTGDPDYMELTIDGSASAGSYAHMYPFSGAMGLNTQYFKENLSKLAETYRSDVAAGFHPKNTGMTDVFVHEMAHRLDAILGEKSGTQFGFISTKIVPEAIKNLKARGTAGNSYEIQNALSGYGASFYNGHTGDKYVETFAEAMADYNKNKKTANPLSQEIYRLAKAYM